MSFYFNSDSDSDINNDSTESSSSSINEGLEKWLKKTKPEEDIVGSSILKMKNYMTI